MEEEDFARIFRGDRQGEIGEERTPDMQSDGRRERRETHLDLMEKMRIFNQRLTKAQEE